MAKDYPCLGDDKDGCDRMRDCGLCPREADLVASREREERWRRCLVKLSSRSSFVEWQEDSPDTWDAFDKALHDGTDGNEIDLEAVEGLLGIAVEKAMQASEGE